MTRKLYVYFIATLYILLASYASAGIVEVVDDDPHQYINFNNWNPAIDSLAIFASIDLDGDFWGIPKTLNHVTSSQLFEYIDPAQNGVGNSIPGRYTGEYWVTTTAYIDGEPIPSGDTSHVTVDYAVVVPVGFSKWQHDDNVFSFNLGSLPRNYQTDDGWDIINNDFAIDADSAYCHTAILKLRVGDNGRSTTRLKWNDVTYEITRRPIKLIWLNSQTKNWIDVIPNLTWPNPTINGNTVTWGFPGFDYSVIKQTTKISHRFTFRDAFLDSAIVLYNQRADSQYIYLGTVTEYSFINVDDSTLLDIPEVDFKRLKTLGKAVFDISKQHVQYDGWESYDLIPVRQRWVKQGGKIYCIEGMKMQKIKELTETFPDIPIWHDAADSFSIDSTTAVDMTHIYSFSGGNDNYGANAVHTLGNNVGTRQNRVPIFFPTLIDSLRTYTAGVDVVDSGFVNVVISVVTGLTAGTSVPDSLGVSLNNMTALWDEGSSTGLNQGAGVRWDSASATGSGGGGNNPNAPLDWTDGGDFEANPEYNDTTWLIGGVVSQWDTLTLKIEGASIVTDTTNLYGWMIHNAYVADGDDGGTGCSVTLRSEDYTADPKTQPYGNFFLTTGAAPAAYPMRRRHIIQKLQGDS